MKSWSEIKMFQHEEGLTLVAIGTSRMSGVRWRPMIATDGFTQILKRSIGNKLLSTWKFHYPHKIYGEHEIEPFVNNLA